MTKEGYLEIQLVDKPSEDRLVNHMDMFLEEGRKREERE